MKYLFLLILSLLFSGCSFSTYFLTENDPYIKFNKQKSIYVFEPENPTIEDKKFKIMLVDSLKNKGFIINEQLPADYGLFFYVNEKSYTSVDTSTVYVPQTSYSSGFVNGRYAYGQTTTNTPVTSTSTVTNTFKKINYYLVNAQKDEKGNRNTEWTGFTSTNKDIYYKNPKIIVDKLVELIGTEYKGDIYFEY